jgi:hypothetical protein
VSSGRRREVQVLLNPPHAMVEFADQDAVAMTEE